MRKAGIRRICYFLDVFDSFTYPDAIASADAFWANSRQTKGIDGLLAGRMTLMTMP
jgi:hypothetical protein